MKTGIYILIALASVLGACRSPKDAATTTENVPKEETSASTSSGGEEEVLTIEGIVRLSPECGTTIRVVQGDVMKYYHPMNLPEKYIVEGMKLRMDAKEVMAKMPAGCEHLVPVTVSNVKEVK